MGYLSFLLIGLLVSVKDCLRSPLTWLRVGGNSYPSPGKGRGKAMVPSVHRAGAVPLRGPPGVLMEARMRVRVVVCLVAVLRM